MSAPRSRRRSVRSLGAALLLVALAAPGCSTVAGRAAPDGGREVRPEAPADYDFLVGRNHELAGRIPEAVAAYQRAVEKDPGAVALYRKLAELLARNGDYAGALRYAERAYDLAPEDPNTRLFLASLYRIQRDLGSAEAVLRGDGGEPLGRDAGLLLFNIYIETDRNEEALAVARSLVQQHPEEIRAHMALAGVYQKLDRIDEFEASLRDVMELHPGNRTAILTTLARVRRERDDREGEVAVLREILEGDPDHLATRSALAEALVALDRTDEAIAVLEGPDGSGGNSQVTLRLALLEYQAGRYESAAERLRLAFEELPGEYEIVYFLGLALQRIDDFESAARAFREVPPQHERYADARVQLAAAYEREGNYSAAIAEIERARAARPLREYDLYLATLQAKSGDFSGAVAFLEDLLREDPDDDEIFYNLGVLYGEEKRIDDALRYMHVALEKNPENASALNYVAYTWAERGENLEEAERMVLRALELRPHDGFITDSLGWIYYMQARALLDAGRDEEARARLESAVEELERASELSGGDPVISEHLGDVHRVLDDPRRALEYYEEAIRLEPREAEQPDLRRKRDELRRELGLQ
ncbi:MAG: tetratricopeptide repeat protein [Deltaproteobacteria bacterium]|nr:MAG: tetratricopeptide repeat protein [Deltaproteobacteria bacterium]